MGEGEDGREVAFALGSVLTSEKIHGSYGEETNITEVVDNLSDHVLAVAHAITSDAGPGRDAAGGTITCVTEALMGVTAGLVQIADAIEAHTEASREKSGPE